MNTDGELDRKEIQWQGVKQPAHSYYNILACVLSLLGRASTGATRHNRHLALYTILASFLIVLAGERAKSLAPNLFRIMAMNEESDPHDLYVILGATIPGHRGDGALKEVVRKGRYTFLEEEGSFILSELGGPVSEWLCGLCAKKVALVLLKRNTAFTGECGGGLSLKIRGVLEMHQIDDVRLGDLVDTCGSCSVLLRQCDAELDLVPVTLMVADP